MFLMSLIVQDSLINIRNSIKTNYALKFKDELKRENHVSQVKKFELLVPPGSRQSLHMYVCSLPVFPSPQFYSVPLEIHIYIDIYIYTLKWLALI